jgi:hypothetical protein
MAIDYQKDRAVLSEVVGAEEAEALLEWLLNHPKGEFDLAALTHLHPANLQVLMAGGAVIAAPPSERSLASWLAAALKPQTG